VGIFFSIYSRSEPVYLVPAWLEGREVIAVFENGPAPKSSQHLKSLKLAGLVAERREERNAYYRPRPEGLLPLSDWMGEHCANGE